jgi:hypothetical protein
MMRLNFKAWLEAYERKAPEDKGKDKGDKGEGVPLDLFGGQEEELNIDPETLKHIYQTEPQIGAHTDFDKMKWRLMPFMIDKLNTKGAEIETFDDEEVPGQQKYKDGHKAHDKDSHKGHVKRKELTDTIGQGFAAAAAGAAGGGMGGAGAPGAPIV